MSNVQLRMAVEKFIHQTCEDPSQLPEAILENLKFLSHANREWTHTIYSSSDREDFIRTHFGRAVLESYLSIDARYGAARADYFRYLVVYEKGGIYMDIKSTATKPLDSILLPTDTFITAQWPYELDGVDIKSIGMHADLPFREYQNWFILGASRVKVLEEVIEVVQKNLLNYNPFINGVGKYGVLRTTGPIAYSKTIHPFVLRGEVRLCSNHDLGLRPTIFKVEDGENPFRETRTSSHYSTLRIPIVFKSRLHSFNVALFFLSKRVSTNVIKVLFKRLKREV